GPGVERALGGREDAEARAVDPRIVGGAVRGERDAAHLRRSLEPEPQVAAGAEPELLPREEAAVGLGEGAAGDGIAGVDGARVAVVTRDPRARDADARLARLGAVADIVVV